MALVAQPFDCRDNDDRKNNRDDGDGSESDSSSDDEEKPQKKKVMFVRCKKCIDKKNMCADCKKRRNCEASERYRLKTKLTRKALKRLKKRNCVLNAKLQVYCENNEFIRQLISSGAIFCHSCSGKLVDPPAAHVAPQPPPHAVVQQQHMQQQWDVPPESPPHAVVQQQRWDPPHADIQQQWNVAPQPSPHTVAQQQPHAVVQQQQWDVAPQPPPHAVVQQQWDVAPQPPPHAMQNNLDRQQHQVDNQMPGEQLHEGQMLDGGALATDRDNVEFAQNYEDHGNY
ncbi:hypothetical protein AAVH_27511 [Aphelenchoides avenae]|nr:hypothetical protein AAVH_27511 [Aphelenchus avenae]